MKMNNNQRLTSIDITRALAIILVVIGHWMPSSAPEGWVAFRDWIYTFHMPLFLFVSGYIFARSEKPYCSLIISKIRRLMVPYLSTSVIIITIKLLTQSDLTVDHPVTPAAYLELFYKPAAGYFLWFIWVLWWCFCIVPLFKGRKAHICLLLVSAVVAYLPFELTDFFALNALKGNMLWFVTGVVAYDCRERVDLDSPVTAIWSTVVMTILTILYFRGVPFSGLILPYIGCIAPVALSSMIGRSIGGNLLRSLLSLSSASYIVYLFHTTFEGFAKGLILKVCPDVSFAWQTIIVVGVGTAGPWILYSLVLKRFELTRRLFIGSK